MSPLQPSSESTTNPYDSSDEDWIRLIPDEILPTARIGAARTWAFVNLILSLAGAIVAIIMGISVLLKSRRERTEETHEETHKVTHNETNKDKNEKTKRGRPLLIILTPILAIIGLILFILTQDMSHPMTLIDWWTPLHLLLLADEILCSIFAFKRGKYETDEAEQKTA